MYLYSLIYNIMRKISLLIFSLIFFSASFLPAQNIKKGFKLLTERADYYPALFIFNSEDNVNTAAGKYGTALVFNAKDFTWVSYKYSQKNRDEFYRNYKYLGNEFRPYYKITAYKQILKIEKLLPQTSKKEFEKLKDYFSANKVRTLKAELEQDFLNLNYEDFNIAYDSLLTAITDEDLLRKLEIKYVGTQFEKIKSSAYYKADKVKKVRELQEEYPILSESYKFDFYIDSLAFSDASSAFQYARILAQNPQTEFKDKILQKISEASQKSNSTYRGRMLYVCEGYADEREALEAYAGLLSDDSALALYRQTDIELAKSGMRERYLIIKPSYKSGKDPLDVLSGMRYTYPAAYAYNAKTGIQIYARDNVYRGDDRLNDYKIIVIFTAAQYFEYEAELNEMSDKIKARLNEMYPDIKIIGQANSYLGSVDVKIKDNPYPITVDFSEQFGDTQSRERALFIGMARTDGEPIAFELKTDDLEEQIKVIKLIAASYFAE